MAAVRKAAIPTIESVSVRQVRTENASDKLNAVLSNLAFPYMLGRTFGGIVSFGKRCEPNEPCGKEVLAPSQVHYTPNDVEEFRNRVRARLQALTPQIADSDLLFEVTWKTAGGEHFTTYVVTSKDEKLRFESMLSFMPVEKSCKEKPASTRPQETSFAWDGEVRNGLGWAVITWHGTVSFQFQRGHLLSQDLCPHKSCLTFNAEPLWQVDDDRTTVTTSPIQSQTVPDEMTLDYRLIWHIGLPDKVTITDFSIELPKPKGNAIAESFAIRGDGTWNKRS